jgi:hypothetical protein
MLAKVLRGLFWAPLEFHTKNEAASVFFRKSTASVGTSPRELQRAFDGGMSYATAEQPRPAGIILGFHLHFIPTPRSWLNLVERWFREITDKRIRRGAFQSVAVQI